MGYICSDIENEDSEFKCKNSKQKYNQYCTDMGGKQIKTEYINLSKGEKPYKIENIDLH